MKMKRLIILLLVAGLILALSLSRQQLFPDERSTATHPGGGPAPALSSKVVPLEVEVAKVEKLRWQPFLETVGSITAVNGVTVSTDLGGRVVQIGFDSGSEVRAGALL